MIKSLIDFSIQAPSAMNLQPWSFVVIQNPKILKHISDETKKKLFNNPNFSKENGEHGIYFLSDPAFDIFHGAPTLIIICAKDNGQKHFKTESDCFLAGQNLMLAATGMGLATCPIGLAIDQLSEIETRKKIGIPRDSTPVLPIAVGYASTPPAYVSRNPPIIKWVR
jgi:nitroreductase